MKQVESRKVYRTILSFYGRKQSPEDIARVVDLSTSKVYKIINSIDGRSPFEHRQVTEVAKRKGFGSPKLLAKSVSGTHFKNIEEFREKLKKEGKREEYKTFFSKYLEEKFAENKTNPYQFGRDNNLSWRTIYKYINKVQLPNIEHANNIITKLGEEPIKTYEQFMTRVKKRKYLVEQRKIEHHQTFAQFLRETMIRQNITPEKLEEKMGETKPSARVIRSYLDAEALPLDHYELPLLRGLKLKANTIDQAIQEWQQEERRKKYSSV